MDSALFYLAMKKKNLVWGLFRSVSDSKMEAFFKVSSTSLIPKSLIFSNFDGRYLA